MSVLTRFCQPHQKVSHESRKSDRTIIIITNLWMLALSCCKKHHQICRTFSSYHCHIGRNVIIKCSKELLLQNIASKVLKNHQIRLLNSNSSIKDTKFFEPLIELKLSHRRRRQNQEIAYKKQKAYELTLQQFSRWLYILYPEIWCLLVSETNKGHE